MIEGGRSRGSRRRRNGGGGGVVGGGSINGRGRRSRRGRVVVVVGCGCGGGLGCQSINGSAGCRRGKSRSVAWECTGYRRGERGRWCSGAGGRGVVIVRQSG